MESSTPLFDLNQPNPNSQSSSSAMIDHISSNANNNNPPDIASQNFQEDINMDSPTQGLQLRLMRQPPAQCVYQRILKPVPSLMVVSDSPQQNPLNATYFVEVSLLKSNSEEELGSLLDGTKVVRVQGQFANFQRLKILQTSQQAATMFRLRFSLKKYVGNEFKFVPNAVVYSNPIEVFSHSIYITGKQSQNNVTPPAIFEMIPTSGSVGMRVCILGANFINSDKLKVRFGQTDLHPTFHESGTLIFNVPPPTATSFAYPCPIRVSNDGENFCQTKVFFSYSG